MSLRRALTVLAALAFVACTHTGVATEVPDLQDMRLAPAGEKIGAPVEVRYAIQGTVARVPRRPLRSRSCRVPPAGCRWSSRPRVTLPSR